MLWSKKSDRAPADADDPAHPQRPGAKNRPTPRRRDQEAANYRPVVVTDRKAAAKADKERRRQATATQRAAMVTGDEAGLPARDKGPERRYVRDYIDARFSVGEVMLPVMLLVLLLSFIKTTWALTIVFLAVYGLLLASVVDAWFMWRKLKGKLTVRFGQPPKGLTMYAVMRAFQIRRTRMPRPQVKRGQWPS
ncbi:MAG: DUF3043 domain-containing protein [Dermatophilaceae bacterium]